MKRTLRSLSALLLALCLLCLPMSALGESYSSVSLTLSNPSISYAGTSLAIDMALNLDVGYDEETAAGRALFSLMGGNETALSGGANWTSSELVFALDGMSRGLSLPLDQMLEAMVSELEGAFNDAGVTSVVTDNLKNEFQSLLDYLSSDDVATKLGEQFVSHVQFELSEGYTFQHGDLVTLSGDAVLFSISMSDLVAFINDIRAQDAQLAERLDALNAALEPFLGMSLDWNALGELPLTLNGSYLQTENSDYAVSLGFDIMAEDSEPAHMDVQLAVLNDPENMSAFFFLNDADLFDLSLEIKIPYNGGDTKIALSCSEMADDENTQMTLVFENNASSQTALSLSVSQNTLYNGEWYNEATDMALVYSAQEAVSTEDSLTYPGHLLCQVTADGFTAGLEFDTALHLYTSDQAYAAPAENLDLSTADEESLNALMEEANAVASQGLMQLLQAAGLADLLG